MGSDSRHHFVKGSGVVGPYVVFCTCIAVLKNRIFITVLRMVQYGVRNMSRKAHSGRVARGVPDVSVFRDEQNTFCGEPSLFSIGNFALGKKERRH